ncbi:MAG: hypothetical protein BRC29_01335 [Nanohaloarchaea archaeon SW_7_43_1]|nr:MAG: hypothetical protein BRC29_01335 [Nanohaloarchaea archaeon SW_7_43_1]
MQKKALVIISIILLSSAVIGVQWKSESATNYIQSYDPTMDLYEDFKINGSNRTDRGFIVEGETGTVRYIPRVTEAFQSDKGQWQDQTLVTIEWAMAPETSNQEIVENPNVSFQISDQTEPIEIDFKSEKTPEFSFSNNYRSTHSIKDSKYETDYGSRGEDLVFNLENIEEMGTEKSEYGFRIPVNQRDDIPVKTLRYRYQEKEDGRDEVIPVDNNPEQSGEDLEKTVNMSSEVEIVVENIPSEHNESSHSGWLRDIDRNKFLHQVEPERGDDTLRYTYRQYPEIDFMRWTDFQNKEELAGNYRMGVDSFRQKGAEFKVTRDEPSEIETDKARKSGPAVDFRTPELQVGGGSFIYVYVPVEVASSGYNLRIEKRSSNELIDEKETTHETIKLHWLDLKEDGLEPGKYIVKLETDEDILRSLDRRYDYNYKTQINDTFEVTEPRGSQDEGIVEEAVDKAKELIDGVLSSENKDSSKQYSSKTSMVENPESIELPVSREAEGVYNDNLWLSVLDDIQNRATLKLWGDVDFKSFKCYSVVTKKAESLTEQNSVKNGIIDPNSGDTLIEIELNSLGEARIQRTNPIEQDEVLYSQCFKENEATNLVQTYSGDLTVKNENIDTINDLKHQYWKPGAEYDDPNTAEDPNSRYILPYNPTGKAAYKDKYRFEGINPNSCKIGLENGLSGAQSGKITINNENDYPIKLGTRFNVAGLGLGADTAWIGPGSSKELSFRQEKGVPSYAKSGAQEGTGTEYSAKINPKWTGSGGGPCQVSCQITGDKGELGSPKGTYSDKCGLKSSSSSAWEEKCREEYELEEKRLESRDKCISNLIIPSCVEGNDDSLKNCEKVMDTLCKDLYGDNSDAVSEGQKEALGEGEEATQTSSGGYRCADGAAAENEENGEIPDLMKEPVPGVSIDG